MPALHRSTKATLLELKPCSFYPRLAATLMVSIEGRVGQQLVDHWVLEWLRAIREYQQTKSRGASRHDDCAGWDVHAHRE